MLRRSAASGFSVGADEKRGFRPTPRPPAGDARGNSLTRIGGGACLCNAAPLADNSVYLLATECPLVSVPGTQFSPPLAAARQTYPFTLADLPYAYDALEPHID